MKYKKIMLITLLLLAVLTIGAVSAADDVALDKVTASDDVDIIADDDNPGDIPGDDLDDDQDDDDDDDDDDDGYGAFYTNETIITNETDDNYDPDAFVAGMNVPNGTLSGAFVISTDDDYDPDEGEIELFRASIIGDMENRWFPDGTGGLVCYAYLSDLNLTAVEDGDSLYFKFIGDDGEPVDEYCDEATLKVTDTYIRFSDDEYEEVNITIAGGEFLLPRDLEQVFVAISVPDGIEGSIVMYVSDEDDEFTYFYKSIDEMEGIEEDGYTVYGIALGDIREDDLNNFLDENSVTIAFLNDDDDEDERASVEFEIDYDGNNTVKFKEIEEITAEGTDLTELEDTIYIAEEANAVTDEAIIIIPADVFEDIEVDNAFMVFISGDDENVLQLYLDDLLIDGNYVISISDLFDIDGLEIESDYNFLIQFYDDENHGNYYIETEDITIYFNPYIYDEVNAFNNDWVIRFTEIEDADDEFNVTISQDGSDDIVKPFKVSELENMAEDEDEEPYYVLTCEDLDLSEPGNYEILVNFTKDGDELISNSLSVQLTNELDIKGPKDGDTFENIQESVFIVQVPEDFEGYVKVFVNGTPVGGNIDLDDLGFSMGPVGREIVLNDFNITESGNYALKVEVYDDEGHLLNEAIANVAVTVGENSVEFNDAYYTQDTYITFNLAAPVNGTFIIYLNGEAAGYYDPADHAIQWVNGKFVDVWFVSEYARFLKVGDYVANITLRDSNNDETPFANGTFSVLSMNADTEDDSYYADEDVIISFDERFINPSKVAKLEVVLIKSWGAMGPEEELLAEFDNDDIRELDDDPDSGLFGFALPNIPVGDSMVILRYYVADNKLDMRNGIYKVASDAVHVTVLELIEPNLTIDVSDITEGESAVVLITTVEDFSGNVTVTITDVDYNVTVENGIGTLSIPGLPVGWHIASAELVASHYVTGEAFTTFEVAAKPIDPNLTIAVANIEEGSPAVVTITTNATFSGNVVVKIGNKEYNVTVANGKGTVSVPNLAVGTYNAVAIFAETDIFAYSEKTTSFTVSKKSVAPVTPAKKADKIKLTLKKVKVRKSAKKLVLKATLKINGKKVKGKIIKFKFNKKTYKAKTNKKGIAKVTIKKKVLKKLKVGKKVKYQATYGKVTKKYTVKVKK